MPKNAPKTKLKKITVLQKKLSSSQQDQLLATLEHRFAAHPRRHKGLPWNKILQKLQVSPKKLQALYNMEITGGEPDVIGYDKKTKKYLFVDCSLQSPAGRRSVCYDDAALQARKKFPPQHSAAQLAKAMGIKLLTEPEYRHLQELGEFDTTTSSWIATPTKIRKLGGALFADRRYNTMFIYHNGADSYYGARGFRGILHL